jgi:N-methylhydantoinase A
VTERYRVGVDVGGTFTDCVLLRPDGTLLLEKTPTTTNDQSAGVLEGLRRLAVAEGYEDVQSLLELCESIVHGTTIADNTMIQMSGAPTGLIVTEGYRDEIELRRCFKEDIWDPPSKPPRRSPAGVCGWRWPSVSLRRGRWTSRWTRRGCARQPPGSVPSA